MKLDFGCGCGLPLELTPDRSRYHNWLTENPDAYGIDIDPAKLAQMARHVPDAKLIAADGHKLPFGDKTFDYVHVGAALHHMLNWHTGLKEVARVTKPGGQVYILESIDNDPIFRALRRIQGSFRGDDIESYFKSDRLIREVAKYYLITSIRHYWRFYLSDILLNLNREPAVSLRFNNWVNSKMSDEFQYRMASHVVIEGIRNE